MKVLLFSHQLISLATAGSTQQFKTIIFQISHYLAPITHQSTYPIQQYVFILLAYEYHTHLSIHISLPFSLIFILDNKLILNHLTPAQPLQLLDISDF